LWKNLCARRDHCDDFAATFGAKLHFSRRQGKQRVIVSAANVVTGVKVGSTLANDNFSSFHNLTTEALDAKVLSVGVATVSGRGRTLLVCHF
jgi:uncharacterized membrane protein AbrB (regulator of aidB expression)